MFFQCKEQKLTSEKVKLKVPYLWTREASKSKKSHRYLKKKKIDLGTAKYLYSATRHLCEWASDGALVSVIHGWISHHAWHWAADVRGGRPPRPAGRRSDRPAPEETAGAKMAARGAGGKKGLLQCLTVRSGAANPTITALLRSVVSAPVRTEDNNSPLNA